MSYKGVYRSYAKILDETYKLKENRRNFFNVEGELFNYNQELSNNKVAVYENDKRMIFSAHGANTISLNITAIQKFFSEENTDDNEKSICRRFKNVVLKTKKEVILLGHSLGVYILGKCMMEHNKQYRSFFFGGFAPRTDSSIVKFIARKPRFTKILYDTDKLANKILEVKGTTKNNFLILNNQNDIIFNTRTNNGHSISNFKKNLSNHVIKKIN